MVMPRIPFIRSDRVIAGFSAVLNAIRRRSMEWRPLASSSVGAWSKGPMEGSDGHAAQRVVAVLMGGIVGGV
jgi:hypothetical protein